MTRPSKPAMTHVPAFGPSLARIRHSAVLAGVALSLLGCDMLGDGLGFVTPDLGLRNVTLSQYPGIQTLGAYYCPEVVGGGLTGALCAVTFGPKPSVKALNFFFDLDFDAGNNGPIPIPIVEALVGLNLFPGQAQQSLGTTCVTFCEADDPACDGSSGAGACADPTTPESGAWDMASAAAGLLFAAGEDGPQGVADNLRIRTIPAGEAINLRMTLGIDPLQMLGVMSQLGGQAVTSLMDGQSFSLDVPYSVQGNLFYDVPKFGRFDAPFGPFDDTWSIAE